MSKQRVGGASAIVIAALSVGVVGCGNTITSSNSSSASDAGSSGAANVAGMTGAAGSAGSSSDAGASGATQASAGASGAAGVGGSLGGSAGSAGANNAAGSGGAPLFGAITCNPGTNGGGRNNLPATTTDPPEWTLAAGVTAGKVTATASYASTGYNEHFPYWVYTSANYVSGMPAIFLLFGDGNEFLTDFHAATVLDNLTATHALPATVALFIDPPSDGDRVQTYDPPTTKYTTFLFDEILPAVVFGKYSISRDPAAWSIVGYSASGGQGWEVLWNRPDDVHKFIGDNTSFGAATTYGVDWVQVIGDAPARPLRVSLLTSMNDLMDQRGSWYVFNQNVNTVLASKGAEWRFVVGTGMHYPPTDGEHDLPNALRWMFQGCAF
jgi:enterochelin esterase-like enzyme